MICQWFKTCRWLEMAQRQHIKCWNFPLLLSQSWMRSGPERAAEFLDLVYRWCSWVHVVTSTTELWGCSVTREPENHDQSKLFFRPSPLRFLWIFLIPCNIDAEISKILAILCWETLLWSCWTELFAIASSIWNNSLQFINIVPNHNKSSPKALYSVLNNITIEYSSIIQHPT